MTFHGPKSEAGKLPYEYHTRRYEVPDEEITPRVAMLLEKFGRPQSDASERREDA